MQFSSFYIPTFGRNRGFKYTADGNGFRLPTEAEWEYAAIAPKSGLAEFEYAGGQKVEEVGWGLSNSQGTIHPVKQKKANAWGLYDMSGNIEEWCHDWYSEYTTKAYFDPMGPTSGTEKVTRGGICGDEKADLRVKERRFTDPENAYPYIGFRIVQPVRP